MPRKQHPAERKNEIPTDTPLNPGIMINADETPFDEPYPGGAVDEHKELEKANQYLNEDIVKQQRDNL